jgi:hypothetical protein
MLCTVLTYLFMHICTLFWFILCFNFICFKSLLIIFLYINVLIFIHSLSMNYFTLQINFYFKILVYIWQMFYFLFLEEIIIIIILFQIYYLMLFYKLKSLLTINSNIYYYLFIYFILMSNICILWLFLNHLLEILTQVQYIHIYILYKICSYIPKYIYIQYILILTVFSM